MPDRRGRIPRERGGGDGAVDAEPDDRRPDADTETDTDTKHVPGSDPAPDPAPDPVPDLPSDPTSDVASDVAPDESGVARRRRRAQFLRELNEAKALRERVKPRQARAARMRQQMRMRTFRW